MKKNKDHTWDLSQLYSSPDDPQIEKDIREFEKRTSSFAASYENKTAHLESPLALLPVLESYEAMNDLADAKPLLYFYFRRDSDATDTIATERIGLIEERMTKASNSVTFFEIDLGKIPASKQSTFLSHPKLARYKVLLERVFSDAKHTLGLSEEKIMSLKSIPAHNMWISANERILNQKTVTWKGKKLPLAEALSLVLSLPTQSSRKQLAQSLTSTLEQVAPVSEAEINAVYTNKKINDELRGYAAPWDSTVRSYRNDPAVVEALVEAVTESFPVAHRFYKLKAKLVGSPKLAYSDRAAKIGKIQATFTFEETTEKLTDIFDSLGSRYKDIFQSFLSERRIDIFPRAGKRAGAYCWGSYGMPTFLLLNHNDDYRSFRTAAHEMGHAFHTELSRIQGPLYCNYSFALAETASTLFESIAAEHIFDSLSDKEKIVALHDNIGNDVSTIFRQIACFNYEKDIHETVRAKGYISKERLAELHNEHMSAYLGPTFKLVPTDGYCFVHWSHIRRFFYVYSYAFGMLVTKALLRKYRKDPSFWTSIEKFLSAGGKDSPENILAEIGLDIRNKEFWREGIREIEDDIKRLEKLVAKR